MDAWVVRKLPFQVAGEIGIKLEEKQLRAGGHAARDLPGMHAFARPVLRDHARLAEIHLARDAVYKRF